MFEFTIDLTDKGLENYALVVESVFYQIHILVAKGPQEHFFYDLTEKGNLKYANQEINKPLK